MHQSIPSANIPPGQPPRFFTYFQPGSRDLYHLNFLGVARGSDLLSIIISTKLSVDTAWRHFSVSNWSTIYCCSLVTKSVSKLREINLSMVLKLKPEGMTTELLDSLPILGFLQNSKLSTPIDRKGWLDLLKYSPSRVGVFVPGAVLFVEKFCPGVGLLTFSKKFLGGCWGLELTDALGPSQSAFIQEINTSDIIFGIHTFTE